MYSQEKKRLLALFIDLIIISITSSVTNNVKLFDIEFFGFIFSSYLNLTFIFVLVYFLFIAIINNGITVGKRIMSIKVVNEETNLKLNMKNRILRAVFKSFAVSLFFLTIIDYLVFNTIFYDRLLKSKTV